MVPHHRRQFETDYVHLFKAKRSAADFILNVFPDAKWHLGRFLEMESERTTIYHMLHAFDRREYWVQIQSKKIK